jgi:hypothetical protein
MKRVFALALMVLALGAGAAWAQLGVSVPQLPDVGVTLPSPDIGETLDNTPLRDLRQLRIQQLLRENRRELEADPRGQPIVRSQILALSMNAEALARAQAMGFTIVDRDALAAGDTLVTLRAPNGMSTRRALGRLREADPEGVYDFDHLHLESGASDQTAPAAAQPSAARGPPTRVGLIDSGVDLEGPLRAAIVMQRAFAGEQPVPAAHGAHVAQRLLAAAPGAQIYAADIYAGAPTGGAASALTRALSWMAAENVPVVNVSLVGPRNRIVETVVESLVRRGHVIVAAVGNDGPAAAPLFPAAYPGVIGVTGVDGRGRVLIEAGRGSHVDFAASGMVSSRVRGTSYAAPIVSGLLANHISADARLDNALEHLRTRARDLGARGRDDVYGHGLLEAP